VRVAENNRGSRRVRGGVVTGVLVAVAVAAFLGARRVVLVAVLVAMFLSSCLDLAPGLALVIAFAAVLFSLWRPVLKVDLLEVRHRS